MRLEKDPDRMNLAELRDALEFIGDESAAESTAPDFMRTRIYEAIIRGDVTTDLKHVIERAEKVVKKEIELRPDQWTTEHEYVGRTAYHPQGMGLVRGVSLDGKYVVINNKFGDRKVPYNSIRFQAIPKSHHAKYKRSKNANGRYSFTNGDRLAVLLRSETREGVEKIGEENGIDSFKYAHLNDGMCRMTIGNILRRKSMAGKPILIRNVEHYDVHLKDEDKPDA